MRRAGAAFLRLRAALVAPAMLLVVAALWFGGEAKSRVVSVAACLSLMLLFFVGEAIVLRRRPLAESYLLASMLLTQLGIATVGILTGGLASPVAPLLFAPTGVGLAAFGRAPEGRWVVGGLCASLAALGVGGQLLGWPALTSPLREGMTVAASVLCAALLYAAIGTLSDAYVSAGDALARAHGTLLQAATLRAADLEAVGARVSHDLKNPLAATKGLIELVHRHSDESQRQRLDVALAELERMNTTLQDYLAFSRPLATLQPSWFDCRAWLEELVAAHEGMAAAAEVTLSFEFRASSPPSPPRWRGDRAKLTDAVANLLVNALHACRPGDRVALTARRDPTRLWIEIQDNGEGMAPEMLSRVGTPYLSSKKLGTGLGVVLARTTIAEHAGSLVFESALGRGTRAAIELPLLLEDEPAP